MTLITDNLTEGTGTADTAEAENDKQAAAVLSKFKDVKTLCKAYSDLEAEFTRRCQRLKELEKANKAESPSDGTNGTPSAARGVPLMTGGGGVTAPKVTPKSVKEAGRLAQEFLKG